MIGDPPDLFQRNPADLGPPEKRVQVVRSRDLLPYSRGVEQSHSQSMEQSLRTTNHYQTGQVQQAILAQPVLNGLHVFAAVDRGTASLYGRVEHPAQARAAERAALGVPGIVAVAQRIVVSRAPHLSDTDIAHEAAEALSNSVHVPESVKATVHERTITLTGEVNWEYEREAACRAVEELPGAAKIVNAVNVRAGTLAVRLEREILATLANRDPLSRVSLSVTTNSRGAIMIEGRVPSVEARREAEAMCWAVPGTASVTSHLEVVADGQQLPTSFPGSAAVSGRPDVGSLP